jgi:hypothetical protein
MVGAMNGENMNAEEHYLSLSRLLENPPDLYNDYASLGAMRWMARAYALAIKTRQVLDIARVATLSEAIASGKTDYVVELMTILYRIHAVAEINAPISVQGAFIGVGNAHDALSAVSKVMSSATSHIRIVDPYMDDKVITDFVVLAAEGIQIELMSDSKTVWPSFKPAIKAFRQQYKVLRPLDARLSAPKTLHDRLIIVDGHAAWDMSQSLKDLAVRSPASITRSGDIAALKIAAYQALWDNASQV